MNFNSFLFEKAKTLEFNKELQSDIWDKKGESYILKEPIRLKLLEIADKWMEFAHIPEKHVKNILFTGSLANYNFTDLSDVDLHILVDYDSISKDFDFLYDYFKDKKQIWGENHEITIKGFPVEMYAQPMSEKPHTNQGVYSISSNKWIKEPKPVEIDIENDAVFQKKLQTFREQIDDIVEGKGTVKSVEKFKEKIRKMRGAAIAKSGEFSQENLIFKSLRNEGYLERLSDYHKDIVDKGLSLESFAEVKKAKSLKNRANYLLEALGGLDPEVEEESVFKVGERVKFKGVASRKEFKEQINGKNKNRRYYSNYKDYLEEFDNIPAGLKGTIKFYLVDENRWGVEFDEPFRGGYDIQGQGRDRHSYYVDQEDLELI